MYLIQRLQQYLIFVTLGGLFSLVFLFFIPGDAKNAFFLGISSARWGLGLLLFTILGGVSWMTWKCLTSADFAQALMERVQGFVERRIVWQGVIGVSTGLFLSSLAFFFKLTDAIEDRFQPYLIRLSPLFLFILLVGFLNLLFFPQLFAAPDERKGMKHEIWAHVMAFGGIMLMAGVMATTGLGILPPRNSWGGWVG